MAKNKRPSSSKLVSVPQVVTELPPAPSPVFQYVVRTSASPFVVYVHRDGGKARTRKRDEAMVWENRDEASVFAEAIAADIEAFVLESPEADQAEEPVTPASEAAPQEPTVSSEQEGAGPVVVSPPDEKGAPSEAPAPTSDALDDLLDLAVMDSLVAASGLPVVQKSSTHVGDPQGLRLVYPRGKIVKSLFLYKCADESLPGFKNAEERKAKRLGQVTHVAVGNIANARLFLETVAKSLQTTEGK